MEGWTLQRHKLKPEKKTAPAGAGLSGRANHIQGGKTFPNVAGSELRSSETPTTKYKIGWPHPHPPPPSPHPYGSFINLSNKTCLNAAKSISQRRYLQCHNLFQSVNLFAHFLFFFTALSGFTAAFLIYKMNHFQTVQLKLGFEMMHLFH